MIETVSRLSAELEGRLKKNSELTLHQNPRWMEALARGYPEWQRRFAVGAPGKLSAVLPFMELTRRGLRQIVSLPFGTYGGPLDLGGAEQDDFAELCRHFRKQLQSPRTLRAEMTLFRPSRKLSSAAAQVFGDLAGSYNTFLVPLAKGFSWIWDTGYENDVRRCVRKARKSGVIVAEETTEDGAKLLRTLHGLQMAGWGEKPHTARGLWAVAESLGADAKIWVARRHKQPLCAVLVLYHQGREVYPWVSGAVPEAREVRAYHCMMNDAIEEACGRGYQVWNWGGSVGRDSVERFKWSMAGQEEPIMRIFYESAWMGRLRSLFIAK